MVYMYTTKDRETSTRSIEQVIDDRIVIDSITAKSRAIAHAGSTSAVARTEMEAMHKSKIMNPNPRRKPSSEDTRLWSRARRVRHSTVIALRVCLAKITKQPGTSHGTTMRAFPTDPA